MKYTKFILLMLLLFLSRTPFAQQGGERSQKDDWITLYKQFATYKCICEITNGAIEKVAIKTKDYSFVVNEEALNNFGDHADSIGRSYAKTIPMVTQFRKAKLYSYKLLLQSCIRFYDTKYLDSVAQKQYKLHVAQDPEDLKRSGY